MLPHAQAVDAVPSTETITRATIVASAVLLAALVAIAAVSLPGSPIQQKPTLGLDLLYRKQFYDTLINDYFDGNRTIVVTTHQVEELGLAVLPTAFAMMLNVWLIQRSGAVFRPGTCPGGPYAGTSRLKPAGGPFHRGLYIIGLRKGDDALKAEPDLG